MWGEGTGECNPPSFEATANASITEYGELHDTIDFEDLDHFPSVKAHTREAVRNTKKPRELPTLILTEDKYTWADFVLGDVVSISRPAGFDSGAQGYRLVSMEANLVPTNRLAFFRAAFDSVVD
jgi:hypothetical protein